MKIQKKPILWPVLISALISAPFVIPLLWIVGVMHFGIIDSSNNLVLWISYIILSSFPAALIFAKILKSRVEKTGRKLKYWDAFKVALTSLSFIQASIVIITVFDFGDDTFTFLSALTLSFFLSVAFTDTLSKNSK